MFILKLCLTHDHFVIEVQRSDSLWRFAVTILGKSKIFKLLRSAPLSTMRHTCVQSVWLVGYNRVNRLFCQHVYGSPLTLQAGIQHWLNCIEKKQNTWLQCNAVHCIGEQCNVENILHLIGKTHPTKICVQTEFFCQIASPPSSKWTLYGNYFSQKLVNSFSFWPPTFFFPYSPKM